MSFVQNVWSKLQDLAASTVAGWLLIGAIVLVGLLWEGGVSLANLIEMRTGLNRVVAFLAIMVGAVGTAAGVYVLLWGGA